MNSFHENSEGLIDFNFEEVFDFLISRDLPVMEVDLLKSLMGVKKLPWKSGELFRWHFSLFHALYCAREDWGWRGFYLNLDPMRIRLVKIPGYNECHYYFPDRGSFCRSSVPDGRLCAGHRGSGDESLAPSFDPLYDFYTNPGNIEFGNGPVLEKLMKGVVIYALKRGEIDRAVKFFNIMTLNKDAIQKRYHRLAKEYHPDRMHGDDSMMKELNACYQVLREVFFL